MAGSGTFEDPYIATTYAELVDYAANTGTYTTVDNDINIADEYPDGDMPTLVVRGIVDGNDKKISNWYKTSSDAIISIIGSYGQIHDLDINNIMCVNSFAIYCENYNAGFKLVDCKIRGKCKGLLSASRGNGSSRNFLRCSIYVKTYWQYGAIDSGYYEFGVKDSYVKFDANPDSAYLWDLSVDTTIDSCYIKSNRLLGRQCLENCACELTTNQTTTVDASATLKNIIDATKAPNVSCSNGYAAIPTADWLDISVLAAAGFNCG